MTWRWFLLTSWILGGGLPAAVMADDPITVESRLSAPTCRLGQDLVWTLEIAWAGKAGDHRIEKVELPPFSGFTVIDRRTTDAIVLEEDSPRFRRSEAVTLRPTAPGSQTIGPGRVELTSAAGEKKSLASASVTVPVGAALGRVVATGAGCVALLLGLGLGFRKLGRRSPRVIETRPQDETRDFDHVMRAPNHREFYARALELLRTGFGRRLGTDLPATREGFVQSLRELGVRDAVMHMTDQIWKELDEGRFNPETPSGRDRDRVVFQIQDLFKELEGRKNVD